MTLPTRLRTYLIERATLHITRSTGPTPSDRFSPWWRKYWLVTSLHGDRASVGHHWVFGIRTHGEADRWMSGACGAVVTASCMAVVDAMSTPADSRLCWILPNGKEAISGPLVAYHDMLTHFPDYGTAATHPQQTIEGINP